MEYDIIKTTHLMDVIVIFQSDVMQTMAFNLR